MSTVLEPMGDRLFVKPLTEDQIRASGIIIPTTALERPQRGEVIALGPEVTAHYDERELTVGDEVLFSKYGGTEMKVDDVALVLLREADVFSRVQTVNGSAPDAESSRSSD